MGNGRKTLVIANWKMNFTVADSLKFLTNFQKGMKAPPENVEVVFAPSFVAIYPVTATLLDTEFKAAAQNMFWEEEGSFTGEVSGVALKDLGVEYVLLGHSERRHIFGETDLDIEKKINAALEQKLKPILCIGETLAEREKNETFKVLEHQLVKALEDKKAHELENLVVAYEPVWAIGTGKTASPDMAEEVQSWIRNLLGKIADGATANTIRILYGGSVNADKTRALISKPNVDGLLVGGASLDPKEFIDIIHIATKKENS